MAADELNELLARMPDIAKAVNAFTSEAVQQDAFNALVGALSGVQASPTRRDDTKPTTEARTVSKLRARQKRGSAATSDPGDDTPEKSPRKRGPAKGPSMVNDLNLRPSGKTSFKDFVSAKAPKSIDEKTVVTVYYLLEELRVSQVTVDHVFTCFREMSGQWKLPATNLRNSLALTKNKKGWIDTRDMSNITLTATGTNVVEHDLPRATKPK